MGSPAREPAEHRRSTASTTPGSASPQQTVRTPAHADGLLRAIGNGSVVDAVGGPGMPLPDQLRLAMERAFAGVKGGISAGPGESAVSGPGDAGEREAAAVANRVTSASVESGAGPDFSTVRVHTGVDADAAARSMSAAAYTVGDDIAFAGGRYQPGTPAGRALLAHELTHVVQQRQRGSVVVQRAPDNAPPPPPSESVLLIPPEWVRRPKSSDLVVAIAGDRMAVLPATGVLLLEPPAPAAAPAPAPRPGRVLALPTVAKESIKMVKVGDTTGFLVDAGGRTAVVVPGAMAAMANALGVRDVRGVLITHLHDDHVRSLVSLVSAHGIRPENMHFPEGFGVNPNAPSSEFARALRQIQNDPALRSLGHSPTAAYRTIAPPPTGDFFRITLQEGPVTFELYGLSEAFRVMQQRRALGEPQTNARVGGRSVASLADTASLLVRATHGPSGLRVLFLSDLRFSDLTMFQTAMGDAAYREMLSGVRIVEGLGHHLGALNDGADRTALAEFLQRTVLVNEKLTVMAQSETIRSGKPFLNRSLIDALAAAGVEVHVAMEPAAGGGTGVFTVNTDGTVTYAGAGSTVARAPDAQVVAAYQRLARLREVEQTLTRYGRFLESSPLTLEDARQAREQLEGSLSRMTSVSAGNIRAGAEGRRDGGLADPAAQATATAGVRVEHPVEARLLPSTLDLLARLREKGSHLEVFERALGQARRTGTMPTEGIDALWELDRETAQRLVGTSGLSRSQQRETLAQLPGAPAPVRVRAVAGVLVLVELVNLAAPLIQAKRAADFNDDVRPGLEDIMWWQAKGVFPALRAINDRFMRSNLDTTSPSVIQNWLNDNDVDFLVMTGIDDRFWDAFSIWATTHLHNYRDWKQFIQLGSPIKVAGGPSFEKQQFEYRVGTITETTLGWDITHRWMRSDRLDTILQAGAARVVTTTKKQIDEAMTRAGILSAVGSAVVTDPRKYRSAGVYENRPKAEGRWRFRTGADPVLYTLAKQNKRTGYERSAVFLKFPDSAAIEHVPAGYVVVGGGDFDTYTSVYSTSNLITVHDAGASLVRKLEPNTYELLLARESDLEEIKK